MAILNILEFPDPRLRTIAQDVDIVDDSVRNIIDDMFETMYDAPGIGLAATQVDIHRRIVVIDISEEKDDPLVLINPSYEILDNTNHEYDEGCLSVPGFYETVERPVSIRLNALDRNGDAYELETDGLLAVCIQHELDHLDGTLFVDHISKLKRNRIRKKLEKQHARSR
ncbi:Peptide deformylase [Sinobacterium norvegicum]|uniref:Peptide deformylase n=1 Tax=Sinobacterium norvegicum TaxID=1641715 RepID=A0ABM9AJ02_9GAMM|nr:peptide deformylase [Sinobacterium norvegicum]CAH0993005.1 Peptide deformylase [Sinobacterium norvegicum]